MPTLVLLPGLDGTGRMFADFIAALGPEVKTIVASYPVDEALDYDQLEPLVRSQLPQDEDFFVLGESFSGPLAIRIAASSPPGLRGLILCCSFARNPLPRCAPFLFLLGAIPVTATPMFLVNFFVFGRFVTPELHAALQAELDKVTPATFRARVKALLSVDVTQLLAAIKLPIVYLQAREDRLISPRSAALVIEQAPHTRIVDFPSPHCLLQTLPAATAAYVRQWMQDHLPNAKV